jgi:hypothetical protein
MTGLMIFAILFFHNISFGQPDNRQPCKIEFYLLKKFKPGSDTTKKSMANFSVDMNDLADTAFIKDNEIIGYSFKTDTIKYNGKSMIATRQMFKVVASVTERINKLNLPLCCGRQFALVVNGQIVYAGYLWNLVSSFGCDGITAFAYDNRIEILRKLPDYDFSIDSNDPRRNKILFNCLTLTNRLTKN